MKVALYTPEEVIARNYVLDGEASCIINIVDATNLERNLYLTTQMMEMDIPIIVALNMADVLRKKGDSIDVKTLERRIGLPVVEISALKGDNVDVLMERAVQAAKEKRNGTSVLKESIIWPAISNAEIALKLKDVPAPLFHAIKLVEKDEIEVKNHPAEAKAVQAAAQADWVPESRPPPKLVSLGGAYSLQSFTSAAFRAASMAYMLSRGGAIK